MDIDRFLETVGGAPILDGLRLCREYEDAFRERAADELRELPWDVDPHDLGQAGWGVIFVQDGDPAVEAALRPLLDRRNDQAGDLYRKIVYTPGWLPRDFLFHQCGEAPGVIDPNVLPYYLLLVGDPETIPFELQYQLSINHAVGRVHFDDVADYERYAEAVVRAETEGLALPRRTVIFSVERGDCATGVLVRHLVMPLVKKWSRLSSGWQLKVRRRKLATKAALKRLLGGDESPGLLLCSCHGYELQAGDIDQERYQGALICQDGDFFHAGDLDEDAHLDGQLIFLFACYGAGTPVRDNFPYEAADETPLALAQRPFIARLPRALLSHGALAVVGHVDRGWTLSFAWGTKRKEKKKEITAVLSLEDCLRQVLHGERLGHAMRPLHRRYTGLAAMLADEIELHKSDPEVRADPVAQRRLAFQWTAHNDARNFVILGDPAVYALGEKP